MSASRRTWHPETARSSSFRRAFGLLLRIQERTESSLTVPRGRWQRRLAQYRTAVQQLPDAPLPRRRVVVVDARIVAEDAVIVTVANVPTHGA